MKIIGRFYKIAKPVEGETAAKIIEETKSVEGVQDAEILEGGTMIRVDADYDEFPRIMERVVNIFRREVLLELSFVKFDYTE